MGIWGGSVNSLWSVPRLFCSTALRVLQPQLWTLNIRDWLELLSKWVSRSVSVPRLFQCLHYWQLKRWLLRHWVFQFIFLENDGVLARKKNKSMVLANIHVIWLSLSMLNYHMWLCRGILGKEPLILTFSANLSNRTKPNYRAEFCPSHIIHCVSFTPLHTCTAARYGKGY